MDGEQVAFVFVMVLRLNDHSATDDVIVKLFQLGCSFANRCLHGF